MEEDKRGWKRIKRGIREDWGGSVSSSNHSLPLWEGWGRGLLFRSV